MKHAEAERMHRKVLAVRQRELGPEHPVMLAAANNLAIALTRRTESKFAQAETMLHEVLAVQQRVLGYEHPDTWGTVNNLAIVMKSQGKRAERRSREGLP